MSISPIKLVFSGLPPALCETLEAELNAAKVHPFLGMEHIEVLRHTEGLIFRLNNGNAGYTYCKNVWGAENDVELFRHFLNDQIRIHYMHIAYEVKEPSDKVVADIMGRYQKYGSRHAAKIDWLWYERMGRHLLLMLIPKEIVREMMRLHGGTLSTQVRGPVAAIRQLPVLAKIVPEEAQDGEVMHRAFVTPYNGSEGGNEYEQCMAIHQSALREVVEADACGVSIGPVGVWSP